ncbi:PREDICTED: uncharacterized protein LOC109384598 [Hipposideros armiger]|uniref:Uncharacterized protein LOC109384598 n=1 Tax=Hipposideros armiger TaxID=186990 RepID=A0A8B7RL51_HIPAR|nr:PREDICTED: uncharacterized protein LOC109384598 [Hipposideros armiger]
MHGAFVSWHVVGCWWLLPTWGILTRLYNAASCVCTYVGVNQILIRDCKHTHAHTPLWQDHTATPKAKKSFSEPWLGSRPWLRCQGPALLSSRALSPPCSCAQLLVLQWPRERGEGTSVPVPFPMAQAATPGGLGLPCSPKQALALYKHLFRCPAGLGQLRAALRQVQEGWACPSGLELPTVLLEMERSRRAQEQLLWDLELLTGAGLGLFWPPQAQFWGLRDQAQCAWSQHSKPRGRMDGGSEQLTSGSSRLCPSPQAGNSLSQNHPERGQGTDLSSAPDLDKVRSETDPRWESPGMSAEPTPGSGPEGREGPSRAHDPEAPSTIIWEPTGEKGHSRSRPSGLPSQGLPEPQDPPEWLGWSLGHDRAELQKLLRIEIPQGQREKTNEGQSGEATQSLTEEVSGGPGQETPQVENTDALQGQRGNRPECQREEAPLEPSKETPQGGEVKILRSSGGRGQISQAWEVAQGEAPAQPREEGHSLGIPGDFYRSLGEQMPQPGGRESPGSPGRSTRLMQDKNDGQRPESALALEDKGSLLEGVPTPPPPPARLLPGPGAVMLAALSTGGSEQQERPTALSGHPGLVSNWHGLQDPGGGPGQAEQQVGEARGPQAGGSAKLPGALGERRGSAEAPKASKAAWSEPRGREASVGVSAAQQETALQRLLELHRAAKCRRQQDREQQRLRVLERLRIARNRHCQVHPLKPPPSSAQIPLQEDAAGQRRALREQLKQVHRERTGRLRALGARNTQNFQQLLWPPGAEEPAPEEQRSPFPAPSNHC